MGQCPYCTCVPVKPAEAPQDARRHSDPLDSGHSSGDEANGVGAGVPDGAAGGEEVEAPGRGSNSSESSGKYSLRGSVGSLGEERHALHDYFADTPVFEDEEEDEVVQVGAMVNGGGVEEGRQPGHGRHQVRKASRGSVSSERGSFSSVASLTTLIKAHVGRSSSLTVPPEDEPLNDCSCPEPCGARGPRTVSLRLPRSHRGAETDTNLPTIYVDDAPRQRCRGRRSSLRRALSLLSLPALLRSEAAGPAIAAAASKQQKPVQKILRQPRRRHNTVRGMSGLAIDGANQRVAAAAAQRSSASGGAVPNLQRAHTLYYPTATTMRHATTARRARSVAT